MIYHVTDKETWEKALITGSYEAPSLHTEGFIHTSSAEQVKGVLERYYKGKTNLVLLHIDEEKLRSLLKYELAPSVNEEFPHIYGPLNTDAVIKTEML
ncbi:MAG: DUF952 domain-containing protein [Ferruginibacter sp.]